MSLPIFAVAAGGGTLALSPLPGRSGDYAADLAGLIAWAPGAVLSMTPTVEMAAKGAAGLPGDLARAGIAWHHAPVADFGAPGAEVAEAWPAIASGLRAVLAQGGRVLVHCHGGCGRSGMAALRLMVEMGEAGADALHRLRAARPCAVETQAQQDWALGGAHA